MRLETLRLTLLKIGGRVYKYADRIRLRLASSHPGQTLWPVLAACRSPVNNPCLAVFVGGWSLEAAEAVGGLSNVGSPGLADETSRRVYRTVDVQNLIPTDSILDLLSRLIDKSLVQVEKRGPHGYPEERYRLLETLRQYGHERLVEEEEVEGVRDRHRDWFLRLAEQAKPELVGPEQVARLDRIGIILFQLGSPALVEEDTGRAEALVQESLSVFCDIGDRVDAAAVLWFGGFLELPVVVNPDVDWEEPLTLLPVDLEQPACSIKALPHRHVLRGAL
jgi:hypothetical protein